VNDANKTQTRAYFDLDVAGMSPYRELPAELGSSHWWHPTGHLRWYDDPQWTEELSGANDHLRSWGHEVVSWKAETVRRILEPDVR
jgi:hypothetical protein